MFLLFVHLTHLYYREMCFISKGLVVNIKFVHVMIMKYC